MIISNIETTQEHKLDDTCSLENHEDHEISRVNTFSSLGINPCGKNDYYNVPKKAINDIVGFDIHILNFVLNVNTVHGSDRCILLIKLLNSGEICKVFTSSKYIREVLEMVDKKDLPIATKIDKIIINNRATSYVFT